MRLRNWMKGHSSKPSRIVDFHERYRTIGQFCRVSVIKER